MQRMTNVNMSSRNVYAELRAGRSQARDEEQWRQPANWIMVSENNLRVGCNFQNAYPLPLWYRVIMLRLSLICWRKSNLQKQEKGNSLLPQFIYKLIYFPQSLRFCSATGCRWQQIPPKRVSNWRHLLIEALWKIIYSINLQSMWSLEWRNELTI